MHALLAVLLLAASAATAPVSGRYCGPASDTAAVQAAFLAEHRGARRVSRSDIMAIAVYRPGGVGQVQYQGAGVGFAYYVATPSGWRSAGSQAPRSTSRAARAFFARMEDLRAAGGTECANPAFVARGSG